VAGERMMFADIPMVVLGLLFFGFVPGFLVVKLWFDHEEFLEQALLSVVFSIMISIAVGIFFGYDRAQADRFGGFTPENVWLGVVAVTSALLVLFIIKQVFARKSMKLASQTIKKDKNPIKRRSRS
jgi:uncharacterized membrane protein